MITCKDVTLQRGLKTLFSQVSFSIYNQQKVGLVGQNGSGKTSLFGLIAGKLQSDTGYIEIAKGTRIVTVKQEVDSDFLDENVIDYVIKGHVQLDEIKTQMDAAFACEDYTLHASLHETFESLGGYQVESKAAQLLDGLGFSQSQFYQPVKSLSGGWRIRLNLAQALLQPADLLLLDEPTNHLDLDAVLWLEKYLQQYDGAIVLISHDRIFLDNVVTRILHIENQTISSFTGNYSSFEKQYHEQRALQQKTYEKQQDKIAHLEQFINRFKAKASKAKQAQSRVKMLERMQKIEAVSDQSQFHFSFIKNTRLPTGALLQLDHAFLGYQQNQAILKDVSKMVFSQMRVGLLGKNGAGKSTLIKSLVGEISLLSGQIKQHPDLRIGYFAQHSLDALDMSASAITQLQRLDSKLTEEEARKFLGRFQFRNEMAFNTIKNFSGGEKARLALAFIVYQAPNFLLLDEPTNHLDINMREALAFALQSFDGALLLISHDRYLLESTVDEYWLVDQGKVADFNGDLNDYYQYMLAQNKALKQNTSPPDKAFDTNKKQDRQERAKQRQALQPLRNRLKKLESQINTLQQDLQQLAELLQDEALYQDKDKLNQSIQQQAQKQQQLDALEGEWLAVCEQIETM
ncbi:ABC-F family ATP-binding cassette domain-containing protein [Facilibium subflavum]|uniref:ABC-F family ATP-binding cassette domain-containing protein n=1 Tax=Facilibium subflavum TaxID=2219058 RepID=UPI000E64CC28|nr:ATP-binding cassette domain-containing protein [Facilibium subflavum]